MRVIVVGAGLGGLSATCHLAGRGHEVLVLERDAHPGGRVTFVEEAGYHLDLGATVLTMTGILSDVFTAAGADMADHLTLERLDPMYRATFPGEDDVLVRAGVDAMTEEIRAKCGAADAAAFPRFCEWLGRLYRLEIANFIDRNFDSVLDLARTPAALVALVRAGAFRRLAPVVADYFRDHRLQKLFSFQSMYAGLSPYDALAVYAVITYMDTVEGVFFPRGGMASVGRALAEAATKAGATMRYGTPVERVLRRPGGGAVTGVRLADGERITADAVVLNPDLPVAYRTLVPELRAPLAARRGEYSPSCALWVAGVRGALPAGASHHNIHFGRQWREAFDALLKRGTLMPDPSILVSSHSRSDPALAPPGCCTLYVLEPTPNLDGQVEWLRERDRFRDDLVGRVAALGYPVDVEVERFLDPMDWERHGMERGTPFGLSHRFFQSGPFRPNNVHADAPGLVFVGSSTVPGVGIPMVLISGRLAADRVESN